MYLFAKEMPETAVKNVKAEANFLQILIRNV